MSNKQYCFNNLSFAAMSNFKFLLTWLCMIGGTIIAFGICAAIFPEESVRPSETSGHEVPNFADQLYGGARNKRDLGGSTGPLQQERLPWQIGDRKTIFFSSRNKGQYEPRKEFVYEFKYSGKNFVLKGNVSIRHRGSNKFSILFTYVLKGEGNVSVELLRQDLPPLLTDGDSEFRLIKDKRPNSCHIRQSDNKTVTVRGPKCLKQGWRRSRRTYSRLENLNTKQKSRTGINSHNILPLLPSNYIRHKSLATSFDATVENLNHLRKQGTKRYRPLAACGVNATLFTQSWICLNPPISPCFLIVVHGSDYKITEKICPKRLPYSKQTPVGKLIS